MTTREKILETAIDLFSERGFNDVSVREITRAVSIKESSLYNHFKSKQEILNEIYEELIKQFDSMTLPEEVIASMIEKMSLEQFLLLSADNFERYMGDPRLRKIWRIISIERFRDERARDFFNKYLVDNAITYQTAVFDSMIKKGLVRKMDPEVLARESYGFMMFIYFRYLELGRDADLTEVKAMVLEHMKFLRLAITPVN
jgi:AcrR family transcriptional regulator